MMFPDILWQHSKNYLGFLGAGGALVFASAIVSLLASPDRLASLPWTILVLFGAGLTCTSSWCSSAVRLWSRIPPRVWRIFFLSATFLAVLVTLFATRWPAYKWSWLAPVYASLPSIWESPLFTWTKAGLNPNQTGGLLAVLLIWVSALALAADKATRASQARRYIYKTFLVLLVSGGSFVVFLTGSRAALATLLVGILGVALWRTRRAIWLWVTGVLIALGSLVALGAFGRIMAFFLQDEYLQTKLVGRLDIWRSALGAIRDHLFTGLGLGVFNEVMPYRYPYHTVGLSYPVSQAHNIFIDVALGLGVIGLAGFLIMVFCIGASCLSLARRSDKHLAIGAQKTSLFDNVEAEIETMAVGTAASLMGYLVFGITDSLGFSSPTGLIFWFLGLCCIHLNSKISKNVYVLENWLYFK